MTPTTVAVRPAAFTQAAHSFSGVRDGLRGDLDKLYFSLQSTSSMAGSDGSGRTFSSAYDRLVNGDKSLLGGIAFLGNACGKMSELLDASAINHANADQGFALCTPTNPSGSPTALETIPTVSVGSSFGGPGEPSNWDKIKEFLQGEVFPDGDPAKLEAAAEAWTSAATCVRTRQGDVDKAIAPVEQERSVEVGPARDQARLISGHLGGLADSLDGAAKMCNEYATHIKEVREKTSEEVTELTCELVGGLVIGALLTLVTAGLSDVLATAAGAARATQVGARIAALIRVFGAAVGRIVGPASYLLDPVGAAAGDLGALMGSRATVFGMELGKGAVRAEELASALKRIPDWAHGELENAADPAKLHQSLLDAGVPREMADEAVANNPYRNMTPDQILDKYWDADKGGWKYPPNDGFLGPPAVSDRIPAGTELDRLGGPSGKFMGNDGASYDARALAPGNAGAYHKYIATDEPWPPNLEVRDDSIAPAFGKEGGGHQWLVYDKETSSQVSVEDLLRAGVIRQVK
ncbi:TNT domain-containing protein [Williamsia sterculiae]|uniref:DUF4237 domain-containing protein n=1 Tax=Williamsia sterculiae TaxID=1344003 RepID=A0A1N7HBD0_9NOCA|nr:TNT domain-containing protein [Williamsia sterculiae]SIS22051.1 Protein of unknown function [Williamsia sterculiae]